MLDTLPQMPFNFFELLLETTQQMPAIPTSSSFCWIRCNKMPTIPTSSDCWKLPQQIPTVPTVSFCWTLTNRCLQFPSSGIMLDTLPQMPAIPTSSDIMLETPQQMLTNPTSSELLLETPQQIPPIPASSELLLDSPQQMLIYSNFFGASAGHSTTNASYSNLFGYQVGKTFSGNNIGGNNIIIGTNISLGDAVAK